MVFDLLEIELKCGRQLTKQASVMQNKHKLGYRGIHRRDSQLSLWDSGKASSWLCETWRS